MHRMPIGSLMLLAALPTCANAASSPDHNQKGILVTAPAQVSAEESLNDWRRMDISSLPAPARKPISKHLEQYRT